MHESRQFFKRNVFSSGFISVVFLPVRSRLTGARFFILTLILLLNTSAGSAGDRPAPGRIMLPHSRVGDIDQAGIKGPSGICFHPKRGTLFAVGDQGHVYEIRTDGTLVKKKRVRKADFEGITHDPGSGLLYIAVEGKEKILELGPEDFQISREFQIPRTFRSRTILGKGGQGIEAIAFAPDADHPQGGTFYVANQSRSLDDQDDVSAILEVEVPLKCAPGTPTSVKILRIITPGATDFSGMHVSPRTGRLLVISDAENALFKLNRQGAVLSAYSLPGKKQEGITVDNAGFLYIAQDSGGIIKLNCSRDDIE